MTQPEKWKILLVDDDAAGREAMSEWLEREGFDPIAVGDGQQAIEHMHDGVAVIVTDLKMPKTDGLELLKIARKKVPHAAVILVSGHGSIDTAVQALKDGAFDFMAKPIRLKELTHRINMAIEKQAMAREIARLHEQLNDRSGIDNMIGVSEPMRDLFERIRLVADARSTVLIEGENGTGKDLAAQAIHHHSSRGKGPFVAVNCAAIPEALVESELFGHEKGAFTGASDRRTGFFQSANKGTLFLDEIGELPLGMQAKLLRAIENRKVLPVGANHEIDVDVRLIAATNRDLKAKVDAGEFREDLYYRLRVVELRIPALRERREDIPLLVRRFIDQLSEENGRPVPQISAEVLEALKSYDWPGNVRELRNTLEGTIVLLRHDRIEMDDLPDHIQAAPPVQNIIQPGMTMQQIEREAIRRALEQSNGHRADAAQALGMSVRTLHRKINEYDLSRGK